MFKTETTGGMDNEVLGERRRTLNERLAEARLPESITPRFTPSEFAQSTIGALRRLCFPFVAPLQDTTGSKAQLLIRWLRRRSLAQIIYVPIIFMLVLITIGPFLWALILHGVHLASNAINTSPSDYLAEMEKIDGKDDEKFFANVRNLGLIALGIVGTMLAVWRSVLAHRAHRLSEKGLIIDRFQKGAQMLESEESSVRLAGIYALRELATSDPEDTYIMVLDLLFDFVRERSKQRDTQTNGEFQTFPPDLQKALDAASNLRDTVRYANQMEMEAKWRPDLRRANLARADLSQMNLSKANCFAVTMRRANLADTNLLNASLRHSDMSRSRLNNTNLQGVQLQNVNMSQATILETSFVDCQIILVNFSRADFSDDIRFESKIRAIWAFESTPPKNPPKEIANAIAYRKEGETWTSFVDRVVKDRPYLRWVERMKRLSPV